jgi:protease-4
MSSRPRVLLLVVLLVLVGAAGLALSLRLHGTSRPAPSRVALVWDVPGDLEDAPASASAFSFAAFRRVRPSLWEIAGGIRRAAEDDNVRALVLHVGGVDWGWARMAEVREVLAVFRASGKPIYVSLQGGEDQAYLLASAGTRVAMPPTTSVYLDGLTASAMFLKGTYDKLGIKPNFQHVGQFKSAVEQYTRTGLSEPARAAMEALLDDEYSLLVDTLAASRHLTPARMREVIDEGPFTARAALAAGLVDTLLDQPELDSLAVVRGKERLGTLSLDRYVGDSDEADGGVQIALIPAAGTIVSGRSRNSGWSGADLGSETLVNTLREACEKRAVKAIVIWVDSPGGSGDASDDVWQEIRRVRKVKPVVVSMSNLAASGGYYIACGADAIVAQPGTITGSIGVFGGKLNLLGLYQKLGLNIETVSRGKHAEMMSAFRDFTPEESARFQEQLDEFYRIFIGRVAQGRAMSEAAVDSIGQGRVWSGTSAKRLGLVDSLGGVQTAIAIARKRAHLAADADVGVVIYPHPHRPFFRRFLEDALEENDDEARVAVLPPVLAAWMRASRFPAGQVLAMMSCEISIR